MIHVQFKNRDIQEIVEKAMIRSVSRAQIADSATAGISKKTSVFVGDKMPAINSGYSKIIIFGKEPVLAGGELHVLGVYSNDEEGARIEFAADSLTKVLHLKRRFFERYDFAKEWNNLGYGKIDLVPGSPWSIASKPEADEPFIWIHDTDGQSVFWYNRAVGPVDGFDWRLVEDFISDYRANEVATVPVLSEIPDGFDGALTFRIDCDENIASGRPLFRLYQRFGHPFSVAIKTDQKMDADAVTLMKDILSRGGSVVSHSHTHACDWGDSPDRPGPKSQGSTWEARTSCDLLKQTLGIDVRYAVSPFHQNPTRAVLGIRDGGIEAFVGGIICNDPEALMARSGIVPFADGAASGSQIISHSQQCMFHGDSYHQAQNSIQVYLDAFETALKTETFFGYLDHPFSNYQYGWNDEDERLEVHTEFLNMVESKKNIWFASLNETLDFLWDRAHANISVVGEAVKLDRKSNRSTKRFTARWNGMRVKFD